MRARALAGIAAALLLPGLTVVTASPARADPADSDGSGLSGLDEFIRPIVESQLEDSGMPGAAVSVVADGETVYSEGFGVSDIDSKKPVDPATTGFFTASVSKVFISQAVMQQVEAGKLELDTDVNEYLTEFSVEDTYPGKPVTLEHLLTHTAGFDGNLDGLIRRSGENIKPLGQWLKDNQPERVREPGKIVSYDNYGSALAGFVVEEVTGKDFAEYTEQNILSPLGMDNTTLQVPHPEDVAGNVATGYLSDGTTVAEGQYAGGVPAGPGPVTTAEDMARWMTGQLADDTGVAERMRQNHFMQDDRLPAGMGLMYENYERNGLKVSTKGGDITGFHSLVATLPEKDVGVYIAYNGDGKDHAAGRDRADLFDRFVDRYFPGGPKRPEPIDGDVSAYAGDYQATRTSHTSLSRMSSLFEGASVTVEAAADGAIVVTSLGAREEPVTYDQIKPGVFAERGGNAMVAFDDGVLATSEAPMVAYQKLSWYQSSTLHLILLAAAAAVLLIGLIGYPIAAAVRRRRGASAHPRFARLARLSAIVAGAGTVACLAGYVVLMSNPSLMMFGSVLASSLPQLTALLAIPAAALVVGTAAAWWRHWWRPAGRICLTVTTAAALTFMMFAFEYNMAAVPLA